MYIYTLTLYMYYTVAKKCLAITVYDKGKRHADGKII